MANNLQQKGDKQMGFIDKVERPCIILKFQFGVFFKNSFNKQKKCSEKTRKENDK